MWRYMANHDVIVEGNTTRNSDAPGGVPVELRQFLDQLVISRLADPIKFWVEVKSVYTNLHKIALKYLPVVATSVPCERLFSKASNLVTQRRNRLKGKRLSSLLFLGSLEQKRWYLQ